MKQVWKKPTFYVIFLFRLYIGKCCWFYLCQTCTQPGPCSTCSDSLLKIGHVKPLQIIVIISLLYISISESLSDITRMCLYRNLKENRLNLWSEIIYNNNMLICIVPYSSIQHSKHWGEHSWFGYGCSFSRLYHMNTVNLLEYGNLMVFHLCRYSSMSDFKNEIVNLFTKSTVQWPSLEGPNYHMYLHLVLVHYY